MAPLFGRFCEVVEGTYLTSGDTCLWTVVVALFTLGYLDTTRLAVATKEGLGSGVDEIDATDIHEIIVEARHKRIGHSHPSALSVRLHVIFLTADIHDHLAGLRSLKIEVGTIFLVNLRELVTGDGCLCEESISRHFNLLGHLDIGALRLKPQMTGYGLTIATTQFTVTGSVEVESVRSVRAVIGRDHLSSMQGVRQFVDLLLAADADTLTTSLYDVTCIKVHLLGLQFQVAAEVVIYLLHHSGPLGISGVRLSLMHQDTFDHTVLLCLLGESD